MVWFLPDQLDRAPHSTPGPSIKLRAGLLGNAPDPSLAGYKPGSWGPPEAYDLLARDGGRWLNEEASMMLEKEAAK
jgi:hypothetical protein